MAGFLNLEQPPQGAYTPVRHARSLSRVWIFAVLALLVGNVYQWVGFSKFRQREQTMQRAIAEADDEMKREAINILGLSIISCPPELPPVSATAATYNLRFSLPCRGRAVLAPLQAAGLIHARRVLKSSAEGKNTPDDNVGEDLVYVEHLRRALAASTSGSTADLNDEERVLLKEIESVDTANSK
jgi:hypothetical protein